MVVRRPGSALVLALWVALLLGAAGVAVVRLAAGGAGTASIEADLARARAAAEGGIWAAATRLAALPSAGARPPVLALEFPLGAAQVRLRASDEDGRIDINAAPAPLLEALFRTGAGLPMPESMALTAAALRWRESATRSAPPGEAPRPGPPFRTVGELAALPGLSPELAEVLRPLVTVHTARPRPAPEAAPPAVLAVLETAEGSLGPASASRPGLRTPGAAPSGAGSRQSWRIEAEARVGATRAAVMAVIQLAPAEGLPGRVLEWRP
jgi:general secretion pathway protein K